jgi:hypothetical protein
MPSIDRQVFKVYKNSLTFIIPSYKVSGHQKQAVRNILVRTKDYNRRVMSKPFNILFCFFFHQVQEFVVGWVLATGKHEILPDQNYVFSVSTLHIGIQLFDYRPTLE